MNKKVLGHIIDWCVNEYGYSRQVTHRLLRYKITSDDFRGQFDPNKVIIGANPKLHDTLIDFIHTVIHEYQHFLQNQDTYDLYEKSLQYRKNPFEIEANKIARRDKKKCLRQIKELINHE